MPPAIGKLDGIARIAPLGSDIELVSCNAELALPEGQLIHCPAHWATDFRTVEVRAELK